MGSGAATFCALMLVALVPYLLTVLPLMTVMTLKRGAPLRPLQWLAGTSWMAALYIAAAFVAGVVHLASLQFGPAVLAVSVAMASPLGVVLAVSDHYIMEHIMLVVAVVASVVAVASVVVAPAPL